MIPDANNLLASALLLPGEQRAHLAASLIDSLDQDRQSAWNAEIFRRVQELDDGTVTPIPWSEKWDKLQRKMDALRKS
jgi:putative addiction module component (TIGR02574 family)